MSNLKADGIFAYDDKSNYLYATNDDVLNLLTSETNLFKTNYRLPEMILDYSMMLGDKRTSVFDGCHNYCDLRFFHIYGRKELSVEGRGTIVMPSGEHVTDVMLYHEVKKTIYDNVPLQSDSAACSYIKKASFTADSIENKLHSRQDYIKTERYWWLSPDVRYPIAEISITGIAGKKTYTCFLLEDSELTSSCLTSKKAKIANKRNDKRNYNYNQNPTEPFINLDGLSCSIAYKDATILNIEFKAEENVSCVYGVYSIDGKSIIENSERLPKGVIERSMQLPTEPQGAMLFRISVKNKTATVKIANKHI